MTWRFFNDALEDVGDEWKKTCYLKFDAIMICMDDSKDDYHKDSGWMLSENNQDYFVNDLAQYPGVWDKFSKEDLMYNTYDWS